MKKDIREKRLIRNLVRECLRDIQESIEEEEEQPVVNDDGTIDVIEVNYQIL